MLIITDPTITSVAPTTAYKDDRIGIWGTGFGAFSGTVLIAASLSCTIYTWSDTYVECTVPYGTGSNLNITVTNVASRSIISSSYFFSYRGIFDSREHALIHVTLMVAIQHVRIARLLPMG